MPLRRIEAPRAGEARGELLRPGEDADRVRGEGDQVGGDAEEQQPVVAVELQDALQAVQVPAHGFGEALGGIGGQAEGAAGGAADGAVEAGVADLHPVLFPGGERRRVQEALIAPSSAGSSGRISFQVVGALHAEIEGEMPGYAGPDLVPDESEQFQAQGREIAVFPVLALDQFAPEQLRIAVAEYVFFQFRRESAARPGSTRRRGRGGRSGTARGSARGNAPASRERGSGGRNGCPRRSLWPGPPPGPAGAGPGRG